ncbi:IscA/HesB family protein [Desulfovibrio sp. OttesenSCG-928-A18]|nr:IscA/HesB family protein [Desulfovibrio sp. OttesenSCG-928-A18]
MFSISAPAIEELDAFFEDKEKTPIRVYLAPGGCSGPRLALALDQPGELDQIFEEGGYSFCINKELLEAAKGISVEFTDMGFQVQSETPFGAPPAGGCGGCSGCGTA